MRRGMIGTAFALFLLGMVLLGGLPLAAQEPDPLVLRDLVVPLDPIAETYAPLLDRIGDARVVLIGEASHGTHEFYAIRAAITRRLIAEKGFSAVAIEADWPDAFRATLYARRQNTDTSAEEALRNFRGFPEWMWRNEDVRDFVAWLRAHQETRPEGTPPVGFYGLDLYSLYPSRDAVLLYLATVDLNAAERAAARYACFDGYQDDPLAYGRAALEDLTLSCEEEAKAQFNILRANATRYVREDGKHGDEAYFYALQSARVVMNGEAYYRLAYQGSNLSWNARDTHMMAVLEAILARQQGGQPARVVVWAHNSHVGDQRATRLGAQGQINLGQLARERYGEDVFIIGFTTYSGTVMAADEWDMPGEVKTVRPSVPESYGYLFNQVGLPRFLLLFEGSPITPAALYEDRLHRAIGVIYRPETELLSHYFEADLAGMYDAVIHVDRTTAVVPLPPLTPAEMAEPPQTYPFGE